MTEEEAKTKWCPFVSAVGETGGTYPMTNREERIGTKTDGAVSRCIASACMAWRPLPIGSVHGFCGLAGGHHT